MVRSRSVLALVALIATCFFIWTPTSIAQYSTGDPNCSGNVDIDDVVYLIAYIFQGGPAPCGEPEGFIAGNSPCKSFAAFAPHRGDVPPDQDCIEYTYDGISSLYIRHYNAGLNCCPVIAANFEISNFVITITELDSLYNGGCDCLCLFDIDYQFVALPPGVYGFRVIEPYLHAGDEPIDFEMDLTGATNGTVCFSRSMYPWGSY